MKLSAFRHVAVCSIRCGQSMHQAVPVATVAPAQATKGSPRMYIGIGTLLLIIILIILFT